MNTKMSNFTSNNNSFLRSVSLETKEHFDTLLKKALHKNDKQKHNHTERITSKLKNSKSEDANTSPPNDHKIHFKNENYILEKFLLDTANIKNGIDSTHKLPELPSHDVLDTLTFLQPKQSKKKTDSSTPVKKEAYKLTSPKLQDHNLLDSIEKCSTNTYPIIKTKTIHTKDDEKSTCSTSTYVVHINEALKHNSRQNSETSSLSDEKEVNVVPIGDIEIHTSTSKNFVQVLNKTKNNEQKNEERTVKVDDLEKENTDNKATPKIINKIVDEEINAMEIKELVHSVKSTRKKETKKPDNETQNDLKNSSSFHYKELIGVIIYKTDKLSLNAVINQPCVKIHFVNSLTGEYLSRSKEIEEVDTCRKIKIISPLITKSYNLQKNKSFIPNWDELLIINDDFDYLLSLKDSVIIFFEVLDFMSFSSASLNYNRDGSESGWFKIAWAFLTPTSKQGHLNINQKLRLQLYKPRKIYTKKPNSECMLYDWWSKGHLIKYPSTLHMEIKRVKAEIIQNSNSLLNADILMDLNKEDKEIIIEKNPVFVPSQYSQSITWSRMGNETCKIPNFLKEKLKCGKKGCFAVKFSNKGMFLACGMADDIKNSIIIYYLMTLSEEYCKFAGHQGIIYNLVWSSNDKYLLSSSADCTVFIWNVYKKQYYPKQILPHPSFVYSVILNNEECQIITGCYDQIIRVWNSTDTIISDYELHKELYGHSGYITSLCFGEENKLFYSADSVGVIIEWCINRKDWLISRTFVMKELQKTVINNIVLHPKLTRLIVFCRDNSHRMIDLQIGCIVQWYRGVNNFRVHTNGCLSPCGSLIFAPSEDGSLLVWNTDTGVLVATYKPFLESCKDNIIPHCIHYHPMEHLIAISHYGLSVPVLLCCYDVKASGRCLYLRDYTTNHSPKASKKKNKKYSRKETSNCNTKNITNTAASFDVIMDKIDTVLAKYE